MDRAGRNGNNQVTVAKSWPLSCPVISLQLLPTFTLTTHRQCVLVVLCVVCAVDVLDVLGVLGVVCVLCVLSVFGVVGVLSVLGVLSVIMCTVINCAVMYTVMYIVVNLYHDGMATRTTLQNPPNTVKKTAIYVPD